jgi:UDP-glucose 4-epimerase
MSNRALVTGGAGFIGSHLVDHLVARGQAVTVLDDFSTGSRENLKIACESGDVRVVTGSIIDTEAVEEATRDCRQVYHLAVQCVRRSLDKPMENHEVNATGTLNVLEAARRRGVRRFIYCSSSEVYGNASDELLDEQKVICEPMTVYGAAKLAGEHYAKAYHRTYGLDTVVVRPFNSYGPREHERGDLAEVIPRFVIRVMNGLPPVIFGAGDNGRDFTYVTDTARGLALAAECDALVGACVNIAYGHMLTIKEVAHTVARLCQRPDLVPVHIQARPGDVYRLHADTRLAERLLDYRAAIDFEAGMEKYLAWFSDAHPDPSELLEDDPVNWRMPDTG